jgi:hypothetical protein
VSDISDAHRAVMQQTTGNTRAQRRAATAYVLRKLADADAQEILAILGLR